MPDADSQLYQQFLLRHYLPLLRGSLVLAAVIFSLFGALDSVRDPAMFARLAPYRLATVVLTLAFFAATWFPAWLEPRFKWLMWTYGGLAILMTTTSTFASTEHQLYGLPRLLMLGTGIFIFSPFRQVFYGLLVLYIAIPAAFFLTHQDMPGGYAYSLGIFLVYTTIIAFIGMVIGRISEQRFDLEQKLNVLACTDSLTGANNRRHFLENLDERWHAYQRYRQDFSLVMLDIDHFKAINDRFGHDGGDRVLVEVGRVFLGQLRQSDQLGRMGGEEFALLLSATTSAGACTLVQRLQAELRDGPLNLNGQTQAVTFSAGIVQTDPELESAEQLLKRADDAMYRAKRAGRDRLELWTEEGSAHDAGGPQMLTL